mmetsp:Transcript_31430/g.75799  ORF Transcript_31430/g.75799 Transcript_31430/m.75799 type:complete len:224 (+) Transcript_31430:1038-1709(+)
MLLFKLSKASAHRCICSRSPIANFRINRSSRVVSSTLTLASPTPTASIMAIATLESHRPIRSRHIRRALSRFAARWASSFWSSLLNSTPFSTSCVFWSGGTNFLLLPMSTIRCTNAISVVLSSFSSVPCRVMTLPSVSLVATEILLTIPSAVLPINWAFSYSFSIYLCAIRDVRNGAVRQSVVRDWANNRSLWRNFWTFASFGSCDFFSSTTCLLATRCSNIS